MSQVKTKPRNFGGANIKGTPAMRAKFVRDDLEVLTPKLDIIGLQEFRWPWYYDELINLVADTWKAYPSMEKGLNSPVLGAQGILYDADIFKRKQVAIAEAFDFDVSTAGIMENRWLRAALLEDIETGLCCWYGSGHFVVGADAHGDSEKRKMLMRQNLDRLDRFLARLVRSGHPVVFEIDANIHKGTWAYIELMKILKKHGARVLGPHGVEYLWVIDGKKGTKVVVDRRWELNKGLHTDHEVRCLRHHLVAA